MMELFGELAIVKIVSLLGVAYLVYVFIQDRRKKK
jgi:threonine/homoserine/homoserine lactone efflux protein